MLATASDADNFTNTTQLLDYFCRWVNYNLLNPTTKEIEQLVPFNWEGAQIFYRTVP
jgi:hypothetical protein